jgi:hypothetical protein
MSKKLLEILLSELKIIRLVCAKQGCGGIAEIPIGKLISVPHLGCPVCGQSFNVNIPNEGFPLAILCQGINFLNAQSDKFQVQFVIPDEAKTA